MAALTALQGWSALWRGPPELLVSLVVGVACGLLARGPLAATRPRRRWAQRAALLSLCGFAVWPAFEDLALGQGALGLEALLAPVLLLFFVPLLRVRQRLGNLGVGALAGLVLIAPPTSGPVALMAIALLLARDGRTEDDRLPPRQAIALVGCGLMSMLLAHGLAFDLAVGLHPHAPAWGAQVYVDGLGTRLPRMALEAAGLLACLALARGRSWGVIAMLLLTPALWAFAAYGSLPAISYGCFGEQHPLGELTALVLGVLMGAAPWLLPLARALSGPSSRRLLSHRG